MNTETIAAPAVIIPSRTIKLPPIGTHLPHLAATFWGVQRALPGSGQADYALHIPDGFDFDITDVAWGGAGVDEPGAKCEWDGQANTLSLLNSKTEHPIVSTLTPELVQGPEGIYVPSHREIKTLFANGCDSFNPKLWYWTSTQFGRYYAYYHYFNYGNTDFTDKSWSGGAARFVRRSSLESLVP